MSEPRSPDPLAAIGIPLHTRMLQITAFQRGPDHVQADGEIVDLRKCGFVPTGGELQTAGFVHHMKLGARVSLASGVLERLDTAQPYVAMEASPPTGGECCRDPASRLQALVGVSLEDGFTQRLNQLFGGALGCSHLLTLAQLMGSTLPSWLALARAERGAREDGERIARRTLFLDGVELEDGSLEVAILLSDFATTPRRDVETPLARLARQHEVRVRARIDMQAMTLVALDAAERQRGASNLDGASWCSHSALLAPLVGGPALRGLAKQAFGRLGGDPSKQPLLDALLNLAPGVIQCMAAYADRMLLQLRSLPPGPSGMPKLASMGGYPDSCYMWRTGGAMDRIRNGG